MAVNNKRKVFVLMISLEKSLGSSMRLLKTVFPTSYAWKFGIFASNDAWLCFAYIIPNCISSAGDSVT